MTADSAGAGSRKRLTGRRELLSSRDVFYPLHSRHRGAGNRVPPFSGAAPACELVAFSAPLSSCRGVLADASTCVVSGRPVLLLTKSRPGSWQLCGLLSMRGTPAREGLLARCLMMGLDPARDLAVCSFYDERNSNTHLDERDVAERVSRYEYDAGAVSRRTIEALQAEGSLSPDSLRIIWSSPGYSHCCFTAQSDMDPALVEKLTQAFVTIDAQDPAGKAVLEGEACKAFVPDITTGWETLGKAAEQLSVL
jgi:hypothetical protein